MGRAPGPQMWAWRLFAWCVCQSRLPRLSERRWLMRLRVRLLFFTRVGLLALAAPLVAMANHGPPHGG